ncbi:hypothetical protein NF556_10345 [Ornithinimicrobium faecis]|uniref:N-acetyltransferase domain-containing protein n=1 Tax=Ornithinimicrobium faecis TaxID=2934158 RepID=A0ABY4YZ01_9MICO|nr:hypothetical protein [Ornithinimicrobium sp. HY1793]USQ82014.1 hypothetical protein NF556_10345 [Ornithinimicrobium sp. HY1793]
MQPAASDSADESFLVRPAREADRHGVPASWWHPDAWRAGARSLVVESAGAIVAAAARCPNRVHPLRHSAWLHLSEGGGRSTTSGEVASGEETSGEVMSSEETSGEVMSSEATSGEVMSGQETSGEETLGAAPSPAGVAVLRALRDAGDLPLSLKAVPGTVEHATIVAAGGVVYQHCPPELVPTGTPTLREWCAAQRAGAARSGVHLVRGAERSTTDLTRAWTQLYEVVHADWSPTAPTADLLEIFGPMIEAELESDSTVLALVDGEIVAASFVFLGSDPAVETVAEALVPGHPHARSAVGACLADVLARTDGRPVEFDGHRSDPHFFPLLASLPDVRAGDTPLDLLEL